MCDFDDSGRADMAKSLFGILPDDICLDDAKTERGGCNWGDAVYDNGFQEGAAAGEERAIREIILPSVRAIMKNLGCSKEKAFELMSIPEEDRDHYSLFL